MEINRGLKMLDSRVNADRTTQLKNLVKERFDDFVQCRETIDRIEQVLSDPKITPAPDTPQLAVEALLHVATKSGYVVYYAYTICLYSIITHLCLVPL
jgi:hypothetical protein